MSTGSAPVGDLLIVGGGINGCGIARDAAGRGLSVSVVEMGDLASATSSASTKLFHGGLRYLDYFKFRLVREALSEREVLLRAMPHISRPMRFVLPYHPDMRFDGGTPAARLLGAVMPWARGRRPIWVIRAGLFLYDRLGGRTILPGTSVLDLQRTPEGVPLKATFKRALEYSDCWVDDARLVALTARDAAARGAEILTRTRLVQASAREGTWLLTLEDAETGQRMVRRAKAVINASGPWVAEIARRVLGHETGAGVRLVRGSHIVTRKLFDHDKCYFFQGTDGRIIFAIPYESDFTLIGTTDADHDDPSEPPVCTEEERAYLLAHASVYFDREVSADDIVWTYSGVRALFDDGSSSATAATRDYVLKLDSVGGAPVLSVFGGKITTHRRLAEAALEKVASSFPQMGAAWTAGAPLPGGDFPVDGVEHLVAELRATHAFLTQGWATRLVRAYGTEGRDMLGDAASAADLGRAFGATLTEREVRWMIRQEFARTSEDVLWRRSKLGLRLTEDEAASLDAWMNAEFAPRIAVGAG
ncbi:MAG: glycerol-3-phosphate dehydrogenase [Rhodobacteraceae bacterium]|nr:glycerol-3-phosphate dehydrogenase [Paracoccaceae bacterium]